MQCLQHLPKCRKRLSITFVMHSKAFAFAPGCSMGQHLAQTPACTSLMLIEQEMSSKSMPDAGPFVQLDASPASPHPSTLPLPHRPHKSIMAYLLRALLTVSTLSSLRLNMFAWADSCLARAGRGRMKKANWASGRICRSRVSKPSILAPNFASPVPCTWRYTAINAARWA